MVERFNRTLGECIAKLVQDNQKEWDSLISSVLLTYRTKQHKSTGLTPFYLVYGRQATLPLDLKIPHKIIQEEENLMINRLY